MAGDRVIERHARFWVIESDSKGFRLVDPLTRFS
jgi:hypothetical protein